MTTRTLRILSGAVMLACALMAQADTLDYKPGDQLPVSPQVKVGKLANGLTYYIQKNGKPEQKVELRLVVKAGSILEDDDQRGLAHFTEHMAFNGSTHFKRNELISYLESIGVKFGADLNAYTSFDETVYMLPIPTDKKDNLETGFNVLEDWAHGLSFNDADIDSERAIIMEELRRGKGADDRINKVLMPKLLNGSRYAERLPIGKEDVILHFQHDAIRRFYRDWYRPDLMAVIVVGDVDPAQAEKMVEAHFGGLKNPEHERPRDYAVIPERTQSEGVVVTDKEAAANVAYIRYPIMPHTDANTYGQYRHDLIESLYSAMLSQRMAELTQQANPPFIQGGSSMGQVVHGYRSFSAGAVVGKGGAEPALTALVQEDERARQFGFTVSELERAKKTLLRTYERYYKERDKSESADYVGEFQRSFLDQEPIPGIENEYKYVNQMVPGITLDEVNAAVKLAIPANEKKLVVYTGSDHSDLPIPQPAALLADVEAAEKATVQAHAEKVYATTLMAHPPKPGRIVKQTRDAALGLTELTLSNGVKVVLKPTDFKNDQVMMSGSRFGGQSLYGQEDIFNARYASTIAGQMGVGAYSPTDLQKVLAGKTAGVAANMGMLSEGVSGGSGSADIETMLQLAYLEFTQPRKDPALYDSFIGKQRELARNALSRPEAVFNDEYYATLYNNNPRVARVARPEDFDHVQLDRAFDIYRSRMASAKGYTFFIVGSFDVEKIKPLLATYLGSLPTAAIPVAYKDLGVRPVRGVVKKDVLKGTEAKSTVSLTFSGDASYNDVERLRLQFLVDVLNIKLVESLREQKGLIYSGGASGSVNKLPYQNYMVGITLPCAPENVDKVIAATFAEIQKLKDKGAELADLNKVKANWMENHLKVVRENGYWLGQLQSAQINGTDPHAILTAAKRVEALTPEDLKAAAQRYFNTDNYVQMVLLPEKPAAAATAAAGTL